MMAQAFFLAAQSAMTPAEVAEKPKKHQTLDRTNSVRARSLIWRNDAACATRTVTEACMAALAHDERQAIADGSARFVEALDAAEPELLKQATAVLAGRAEPRAGFLADYTAALGSLVPDRFPESLQSLLEAEDADLALLQSGDGRTPLGRFVLRAFQKRLCNPATEADLKDEVARIRKDHGLDINPTAAGISGGAATAVALTVGSIIGGGAVATVLAPLAGSVALLLLIVGVDTFCGWAAERAG